MPRRWPWAIAATACSPFLFRSAALVEEAGQIAAIDLRGLISDLGVSSVAAACAMGLARVRCWLAVAFIWLWTAAHYANYELVVTLGAPATLRDLHYLVDPTFFAGSALAISQPGLLLLAVVFGSVASALGARAERAPALMVAIAGVALGGVAAALPSSPEQPGWRQVDFLQSDIARASTGWLEPGRAAPSGVTPPAAMLELLPSLAADLGGESRLTPEPRARNVLLVVLESISGIHLESFAREQGRRADVAMPALDALAGESLRYVNFVAHQRKTNRGLYALLCGELPNLGAGTPKMSAAALAPWRVCLPEVLREAGFQTAYLQAAPLAFMMKDRFMLSAGFDQVDGYDGDEFAYAPSAWGQDDRAFFEQVAGEIEKLRSAADPWFLTVLNVGTHHPYRVPDDYRPGPRSFGRAAAYLDEAFEAFMNRLEQSGVFDDTLLVVTSDESLGISSFETEPSFKLLSQNWGLLLLRGPGVPVGVAREPFGLADLPLSLADYLELPGSAGHFHGRSVFRRYASPRHLFFGNANHGSLGAFEPEGTVLSCPDGSQCLRYAVPDGRWFGVLPEGVPANDANVALLRELAERSAPDEGHRPDRYELMLGPEIRLFDQRARLLHGGQYVHLAADEWLEVTYTVSVEGEGPVEVDWAHRLTGFRNEMIHPMRERLRAGQRLSVRYRYVPEKELGHLQCRTIVRLLSGEQALLRHGEARLEIHRGDHRPARSGVEVLRHELETSRSPFDHRIN